MSFFKKFFGRDPDKLRESIAHYEKLLSTIPEYVESPKMPGSEYEDDLYRAGLLGTETLKNGKYVKVEKKIQKLKAKLERISR